MLITGTSQKIKSVLTTTPLLLESLYEHNSDGLGIMYATSKGLKVIKKLPKTVAEARSLISAMPSDDRQLAMHWRMRTHGHIDLSNCHPYEVSATTQLMHNGVLHTGNGKDTSRSDTYHFIQDYLRTIPDDTLHNEQFQLILGDMIGNNRFAIMSEDGRLSVVNKQQGIEFEGVWFSNTYAMDASILFPERKKKPVTTTSHWSSGWYNDWTKGTNASAASGNWYSNVPKSYELMDEYEDAYEGYTADPILSDVEQGVLEGLEYLDNEALAHCFFTYPEEAVAAVLDNVVLEFAPDTVHSDPYVQAWVGYHERPLVHAAKSKDPIVLAELVNALLSLDCQIDLSMKGYA